MTQGALVGSLRKWIFEDLYEQCSFHIAEKMPSSVNVGVRPISLRMRSYSSGLSPCAATSAAVTLGSAPGARTGAGLEGLGAGASAARCFAALPPPFAGDLADGLWGRCEAAFLGAVFRTFAFLVFLDAALERLALVAAAFVITSRCHRRVFCGNPSMDEVHSNIPP